MPDAALSRLTKIAMISKELRYINLEVKSGGASMACLEQFLELQVVKKRVSLNYYNELGKKVKF